ncbi:MAG TPA: hypothetical protein PLT65_05565 [Bacilli bacterium]|nr:hypothetical protein [Bacilli bacterium]
MVNVEFSDEKHCYMDGKLYEKIQNTKKKVKKDDDRVFLIDGGERKGKSVLAQQIARTFDPSFNHERMCFTEEEFAYWIDHAEKGQSVVYDEAYRGLGSDKWADKIAKVLRSKMMEMGQKNLVVFIVCPNFFLLHKYIALHRSDGLFHVYTKKGQRGHWAYFNHKTKQILYLKGKNTLSYTGANFPKANMIGRFLNHYVIDEDEYRKKKKASYQDFGMEDDKKDKATQFRNSFVYKFYVEHDRNAENTSRLLKDEGLDISPNTVRRIVQAKERSNGKV